MDSRPLHIGLVIPSLGGGGAERVAICLADQLIQRGCRLDFVLGKPVVKYPDSLPKGLRLFYTAVPGGGRALSRDCRRRGVTSRGIWPDVGSVWRDVAALRALGTRLRFKHVVFSHLVATYLRRQRPQVLLSSLAPANIVAVSAASLVPRSPPVIISVHNNFGKDYSEYEQRAAVALYPRAAMAVAVSHGVREELGESVNIAAERARTIYNPVPAARVRQLASQDVSHPWFQPNEPDVILSVGREAPQKDYATLVRAFALVRRERPARLVIMGKLSKACRARLQAQAAACGAQQDLNFLGFDENPYRYMARAKVFALASFWEGLPTVLVEALACGTPIVSTDTRFGPREILADGRWGRLTAVGDSESLAQALLATLRGEHPSGDALRERAGWFSEERAVDAYLRLFRQAI